MSPRTRSPEPFESLARLSLGAAADASPWVKPLARLLEASSQGVGSLPVDEAFDSADPGSAPTAYFALDGDRVLLPRTAYAWRTVRAAVEGAGTVRTFDDDAVRAALDRILPPDLRGGRVRNAQQRLAAAHFADRRFGVLTGGPGTGKTTSAAALIALVAALDPSLTAGDVAVCAPTGKAANRLRRSIEKAAGRLGLDARERDLLLALRPNTLHRTLGWSPKPPEAGGPWRFGPSRPLPARLVLLDEASMADVELTAALVCALAPDAALIFLGDRDQLDSVEAGGVLAELVQRGSAADLDDEIEARLVARCGPDAVPQWREGLPRTTTARAPLPGLAVGLSHSYRAESSPWILGLAALVRPGAGRDAKAVLDFFAKHRAGHLIRFEDGRAFDDHCEAGWARLADAAADWRASAPPHDDALQAALDTFQLIVGTNGQVERANRRGARFLARRADAKDLGPSQPILHGSPIIVGANDRGLDLSNGDVGVALGDGPGKPARVAVFPGQDRAIPLARLPAHRLAFAVTVHKSQGSEWSEVAIDVPERATELLEPRLLYTAITRSSQKVTLRASEKALRAVLEGGGSA